MAKAIEQLESGLTIGHAGQEAVGAGEVVLSRLARNLTLCALAFTAGNGCTSAYRISQESKTLEGVPFFTKTAGCRHETSYIEPVYRLALRLEPPEAEVSSTGGKEPDAAKSNAQQVAKPRPVVTLAEKDVSETTYRSDAFKALAAMFAKSEVDWSKALESLRNLSAHDGSKLPNKDDTWLVANNVRSEVFVDYSQPRYFNATVPWIGSTHATAEIASDGTLSKAEVQTETKTVETLLGLLPVKDFLSSKLGLVEAERALLPPVEKGTLVLVVESRFYRHTFSQLVAGAGLCAAAPQLELKLDTSVNYTREEVQGKADPPKDEDQAVSFSGRVVLPKKQ